MSLKLTLDDFPDLEINDIQIAINLSKRNPNI